ncbi:MAG: saccharopine dehydrogenase [Clostridia bacterium]|nr:saccharopine dehydrogenase [Clostridia bacterium]
MKNILVIGAGLSASTLIRYLLDHAEQHDWHITLGDKDCTLAERKINKHPRGKAICFDANNRQQSWEEVSHADIVVSMLPAFMHSLIATDCVKQGKTMVTASYVSDEIRALDTAARKAGVLLLNEIGVDPGIDHMSAMHVLDKLREQGAEMTEFRSYCGGLVAPQSDNNPWNYKFTWAPRNVILAGQGMAQAIVDGTYQYIPYHQLFRRTTRVEVLNYGEFEAYLNRDSLKYRSVYGLDGIPTMVRGTLRRPGYSQTWDIFVQLGLTNDTVTIENSENMTYLDFLNAFIEPDPCCTPEENLAFYTGITTDSMEMYRLRWLGLFDSNKKIGLKQATPAQILQKLLAEKWVFLPHDRDMIVMQHQFGYRLQGEQRHMLSSMIVEGDDPVHTAMAKTVGLPIAIAVKLILTGKLKHTGVHIPTIKEIYLPVLHELEDYGIRFIEEEEAAEN